MEYRHIPVMLEEVIYFFDPQPGENYIDCTLGGAGYTMEISQKIKTEGKILAIDLDKIAIKNAVKIISQKKIDNIILVHDNFKNLHKIIEENWQDKPIKSFSGIVFDLGLSSAHLEDRNRGFSFQLDAPLKMNFDQEAELTAEEILNSWSMADLERIFREYGEEKFSNRIAHKIVEYRKTERIIKTKQLVEIIFQCVPKRMQLGKINPATKVFQALRIATNEELENLEEALPQAVDLLMPGGKIIIISYHSLEDRIVKQYFKKESKDCICSPEIPICQCGHKAKLKIITSKIVIPNEKEIKLNPRARSAKMRVAEKI